MTQPTLKIQKTSQPPDLSKVQSRESDPNGPGSKDLDVSQLEKEVANAESNLETDKFLKRSIQAFEQSDTYWKSTIAPAMEDNLRAYHNKHSSMSAMGFDGQEQNNGLYRPKTRTIIEKYKAAAQQSFFSNLDVVSIEPENPSDKAEIVSASIVKSLINWRLKKCIPWYNICIGGFDSALTQSLVVAFCEWEYKEKDGKTIEGPKVELVPLENMRWSPSADAADIVNSTPYIIMLKPMYIGDLKDAMEDGKFLKIPDKDIASSVQAENTVAQERAPGEIDPQQITQKESIHDYQTVVVQMHIHRIKGDDWIWYTLDNTQMLSKPELLTEKHFHGKRPFIIGSTNIEPNNAFVDSLPELLAGLQDEMNILANQRRTNVDMALNRKWRVDPELGDQVDMQALIDNAPSVVFAPKDSVEPLAVPDVTQSSYQEQMGMDQDFNELAGNFNPSNSLASKTPQDSPFRTNQMLNSQANMLVDSRLKCYALTFIEPLLRLLVLLEQHYETDETVIALAGMQAGMFQKIGPKIQWSKEAGQMMGKPTPEFLQGQQQQQGAPAPGGQPPQGGPQMNASMAPGAPPAQGAPAPQQDPAAMQQPQGGAPGQPPPPPQESGPSAELPPGVDIEALIKRELVINVNVGLNATSPDTKLQKLVMAIDKLQQWFANPAHAAFDMGDVFKEVFALCGYGDGKRFLANGGNPEVMILRQQVMQLTMMMKQQTQKTQMVEQNKQGIAKLNSDTKLKIAAAEIEQDVKELNMHGIETALAHHASMAELEHARTMQAQAQTHEKEQQQVEHLQAATGAGAQPTEEPPQ